MAKDLKGRELGKGFSQRPNGSYCARYSDARGKRVSIYARDLSELKKKYNEKIYERNHDLSLLDENITVDGWFEHWMKVYKNNAVRESTKAIYKDIYTRLISPALGSMKLNTVRKIHVQNLINDQLAKNDYSFQVLDKIRRILNDMYGRAIEDDYARKNPTKGVSIPKEKGERYHVLSKDEQALFFETAAGTFYDNLFNVAVNTGLRPGELFALREKDIDFKAKTIKVTRTLLYAELENDKKKTFHLGPPKTKTSIRDVPINGTCEKYLLRQITLKKMLSLKFPKRGEFADLLFVTTRNTPLNATLYSEAIQRIVNLRNEMLDDTEKLEKFGGHTFRHTFATRCLEAGVKPKTIQSYLGHATLEMTMNLYVHTMENIKQEEIELLEQNINTLDSGYVDKVLQKAANDNIPVMPSMD